MKKITSLFYLCLLGFFISGCGDDIDCNDANLDQNWATELQAVRNTGNTYGSDPTSENCNAYKDALKEYLNVIRDYENCFDTANEREQFNDTVDDANDVIDSLEC